MPQEQKFTAGGVKAGISVFKIRNTPHGMKFNFCYKFL